MSHWGRFTYLCSRLRIHRLPCIFIIYFAYVNNPGSHNVWPPDGKRKYLLYLTTWAPIVISKGFGSISCNWRPQTFGFQMVSVSKFTGSGYIIHGAILIICVFIGIIRIGAHLGDLATVFSL